MEATPYEDKLFDFLSLFIAIFRWRPLAKAGQRHIGFFAAIGLKKVEYPSFSNIFIAASTPIPIDAPFHTTKNKAYWPFVVGNIVAFSILTRRKWK
jgi:hypothetical protein